MNAEEIQKHLDDMNNSTRQEIKKERQQSYKDHLKELGIDQIELEG